MKARRLLLPGLLVGFAALPVLAQSNRPITIVVPAPPGGANDTLARLLVSGGFQQATGSPVVVLNKPGGNLIIGTNYVAKSEPDGHTLLLVGNSAVTVNPVLNPNLPYDAQKDLQPISMVSMLEMLLAVHPSVPANSVEEFVAYAKSRPQALNYGAGTPVFQMGVEMFKKLTGTQITHVPYNGTARAMTGILAGEVDMTITEATVSVPHVKAGKLKALAAIPRVNGLPDLPPLSKSVPGFNMSVWLALFAPGGTPPSVVSKLHAEVVRVLSSPEVRQKMVNIGQQPVGGTPKELAATIEDNIVSFRALAKSANIKPN